MFRYLSIRSYCSGIYTQSSFTSSVQLKYSGFLLESTPHVLHRMNQTHRFDATENINQSPSGIVVNKKRKARVDEFNKEIDLYNSFTTILENDRVLFLQILIE
jgi:hypothetical protein